MTTNKKTQSMRSILDKMPGFLDKQPAVIAHRENEKRKKQQEEEARNMYVFGRKDNPSPNPSKPLPGTGYGAGYETEEVDYEPPSDPEDGEVSGDVNTVSPGAEAAASATSEAVSTTSEAQPQKPKIIKRMKATEMKESGVFRSSKTFPPGAKCKTSSSNKQEESKTTPVVRQSTRKRNVEEVYGYDPLAKNPPRENPNFTMSEGYILVEDGISKSGQKIQNKISVYDIYDTSGVMRYHRYDDDRTIKLRFLWWTEVRGREISRSDTIGARRSWSTFLYYYNRGKADFRERMKGVYLRGRKMFARRNQAIPADFPPPMEELGSGMELYGISSFPYPSDWIHKDQPVKAEPKQKHHVVTRDTKEKVTSAHRKRSFSPEEREAVDSDAWSPSPCSPSDESDVLVADDSDEPSSPVRTGSPDQERLASGRPEVPKLVKGNQPISPRSHSSRGVSASSADAPQQTSHLRASPLTEVGATRELLEKELDNRALIDTLESEVKSQYVKQRELEEFGFAPLYVVKRDFVSHALRQQDVQNFEALIAKLSGQIQDQDKKIQDLENRLKLQTLALVGLQDKVSNDQHKRSDEASSS